MDLLCFVEMHRTQTDFDNHFTIKVFIFQFVNIYSSIFYIAFIKGKYVSNIFCRIEMKLFFRAVGYPGNYVKIFNLRQEEVRLMITHIFSIVFLLSQCGQGGCLMELAVQLGIIMIGKQAATNIQEIMWP
jgi:hypothetical protein